MKINYNRLKQLNLEALTDEGLELSCYHNIQAAVHRVLSPDDDVSEMQINLLQDLGILIENEDDKPFVKPFNFTSNG